MVRLALASEYSRLPIRRSDISAKVLGEQGARQFKIVFEQAQKELKTRFGMEMSELPAREKTTITQRRGEFGPAFPILHHLHAPMRNKEKLIRMTSTAAQKIEKPSSSNKSWILTTTLPPSYQTPQILPPAKAPSASTESTYTGLYSFIIALILLNGGSLPEPKLDRYLARMNADQHTPLDNTEKLLQRLVREGYLVRTREMDGGEEQIEFVVGPRGKIEVGAKGVAGLVREVYGHASNASSSNGDGDGDGESAGLTQVAREEREVFEARLRRSLGIREQPRQQQGEVARSNGQRGDAEERESEEAPRRSRRSAPATQRDSDSSSEEEEEEEGEAASDSD